MLVLRKKKKMQVQNIIATYTTVVNSFGHCLKETVCSLTKIGFVSLVQKSSSKNGCPKDTISESRIPTNLKGIYDWLNEESSNNLSQKLGSKINVNIFEIT